MDNIDRFDKKYFQFINGNCLNCRKSTTIRVFLISTCAEDFDLERNFLIKYVYKDLKDKYDDIILIDRHWGIDDKIPLVNTLMKNVFLNEYNKYDAPYDTLLIILWNGKFSPKQLKHSISENDYDEIFKKIDKHKINYGKIDNIFEYFYELDENEQGNERRKLKTFTYNKSRNNIYETREAEKMLLKISFETTRINNNENKKQYCMFGIDEEIRDAVFKRTGGLKQTLVFWCDSDDSEKFNSENGYDNNAVRELRQSMKNKLQFENQFIIEKMTEDMDRNDYLIQFGNTFSKAIDLRINESWKSHDMEDLDTFDAEIMHHAIYCDNVLKNTISREKLFNKAKQYIKDNEDQKPFFIGGDVSSGKTYSIACLARALANESTNNVVIVRFIGTSLLSSTVRSLLQTIIHQLTKLINFKSRQIDNQDLTILSLASLKTLLKEKFKQFSNVYVGKKLIIMIDSIDRLYDEDPDYNWIIHDLPKYVKFIYSTSVTQNGTLLSEESFKLDQYGFHSLSIRDFEIDEALDLIKEWLKNENRQLTDQQHSELMTLLEKAKLTPLYVKLIFNIVNKWSSSFRPDVEFRFCATVKDTIKYYFDKLEKTHGRLLLSKCLFYITVFKNGINESQLIDILNLDNEILMNIIGNQKLVQMQRFPVVFWLRLKQDLSDFLIEKEFNGVTIISWRNSVFQESIEKIFTEIYKPSDTKDSNLLNMIDYFTETPTTKQAAVNNYQIKNPKIEYSYKRGLTQQFTRLNSQLINELPQIILAINNQEKKLLALAQHIFLNFNYIFAKAKKKNLLFLTSIHNVIDELTKKAAQTQAAVQACLADLYKISTVYKENYLQIQSSPSSLSYIVLSRLRNCLVNNNIVGFLNKFEADSLDACSLIIPYVTSNVFNTNVQEIYTINPDSKITNFFYSTIDCPYLFLVLNSNEIHIINYQTLKQIGTLKIQFEIKNNFIFPIFYRKPNHNCQRMNFIQAAFVYENDNVIYKLNTFDLKQIQIKTYPHRIKDMHLLSLNALLVQFDNYFEIINLEKNEVVCHQDVKFGIKQLLINKFKNTISTPDYDNIDRIVIVIIDKSNQVEIYNFLKAQHQLNLIFDMASDIVNNNDIDDCYIDELFFIENIYLYNFNQFTMFDLNNLALYVRVGLLSKKTNSIKLINLFTDSQYEIITYELQINILNIERFFNNKVIFNSIEDFVYIYDFGKNKLIDAYFSFNGESNTYSRSLFLNDHKLILQGRYGIEFYEINEYDVNDENLFSIQLARVDLNPNEMHVVDPSCILCIDNDHTSIKRIDYLAAICDNNRFNDAKIEKLLSHIDEDYILVEMRDEVAIMNAFNQSLVAWLSTRNSVIIGYSPNFVVILKSSELVLYHIKLQAKNQYKFNQIQKIHLTFDPTANSEDLEWKNLNKCFFLSNELIINLYNRQNNYIEIHKFKVNSNDYNDIMYEMYQVDCIMKSNDSQNQQQQSQPYELHECSQITSLNNYLIIFDHSFVYYINITDNKILIKQKLNFTLNKMLNIENTNDILTFYNDNIEPGTAYADSLKTKKASLLYVKLVQKSNSLAYELKVIEKIFYKKIDDIRLHKNQFIVLCDDRCSIEIYNVEHLLKNNLFELNQFNMNFNSLTNDYISLVSLTQNVDYILVISENRYLFLIKLSTKSVIATIPLQIHFNNLISSNKYASMLSTSDGLLYSFLIVDPAEADHLKRLDELRANKSFMKKNIVISDEQTRTKLTEALKSDYFNTDLYSFDEAYRKRNTDANYGKLINYLRQRIKMTYFIGYNDGEEMIENDNFKSTESLNENYRSAENLFDNEIAIVRENEKIELEKSHSLNASFEGVYEDADDHSKMEVHHVMHQPNEIAENHFEENYVEEPEEPEIVNEEYFIGGLIRKEDSAEKLNGMIEIPIDVEENNMEPEYASSIGNEIDVEQERHFDENHCDLNNENDDEETVDYNHVETNYLDQNLDSLENEENIKEHNGEVYHGYEEENSFSNEENNSDTSYSNAETVKENQNSSNTNLNYIQAFRINDSMDKSVLDKSDFQQFDFQHDNFKAIKIYWTYDSSCVFVVTWSYDGITSVYSMNNLNSKIINIFRLPSNSNFILPCIHGIISESSNDIYLTNYDDSQILLKQYKQNQIKNMFLLSTTHLIVVFDSHIHIINITTYELVEKKFNKKIKFVLSNIPKNVVFVPEFDLVDTIFIIIFENNTIEIFKFFKEKQYISLVLETIISEDYVIDNVLIDGLFSIENIVSSKEIYYYNKKCDLQAQFLERLAKDGNNKNSKLIIRFALWNRKKSMLKILNASNNFKTSAIDTEIIEFKKKYFYRYWESGIIDFYNNRVLLQADGGIYMFDVEKRILVDLTRCFTSIGSYPQFIGDTKIIAQRLDRLELHEISRYDDSDKELKTIILSTVNIKIHESKIKNLVKFNEPGDGCRLAKLDYFTDCLNNKENYPEDLVQHEYGLFNQAYGYFRDHNFNNDLFNYKSKPTQALDYSKVLRNFQKGIQKWPFITNFEVTTTKDD